MTLLIDKVFYPGIGIEVVFNLDSLSPTVRSSIIFDCDHKSKTITIAQTTPQILPNTPFDQMSMTTLVRKDSTDFQRVGLNCDIQKIIKNYALSGDTRTTAIILNYKTPVFETNIRTAYRLEPTPGFDVTGKLIIKGNDYFAGSDFTVNNISITGIGFLARKKIKNKLNPILSSVKPGNRAKLGLLLRIVSGEKESITPITTNLSIARVNANHNKLSGFIGCSFLNMRSEDEEKLSKFIHEAQLYKIRKNSGF